jgi:hypothetical protein
VLGMRGTALSAGDLAVQIVCNQPELLTRGPIVAQVSELPLNDFLLWFKESVGQESPLLFAV